VCFYRQTDRQTDRNIADSNGEHKEEMLSMINLLQVQLLVKHIGSFILNLGHVKPLKVIKFVLLPEYLVFREAPRRRILHNSILGNCTTIFQVRTKPVPLCQSLGQAPCHLHVLNHGGCTHTEGAVLKTMPWSIKAK